LKGLYARLDIRLDIVNFCFLHLKVRMKTNAIANEPKGGNKGDCRFERDRLLQN